MFRKILIANRGEIAVRIMATCHEMGIRTVAVYSEADRHARHVRFADEAYLIGPAPATQSYLRSDVLLEVAQRCGAEALHPGYGFLSENANFAAACTQAGIVFIGPPASAMRLMGSKIAAKALAQSVGAPTVPGYNGDSQEDKILFAQAEQIGFPLLIKASAGGGGKGMRSVTEMQDFGEQLAGARREALAAFGDETVFLEKLIQRPRHIEIQILGDQYGNLIHLGERECSIQRRHQKVLEESPSVALSPQLRAAMGQAAVEIARAAGYVNAGTIEFMLDDDQRFYFLEMNTRLQVEHPVTELVTGLDLVRHQITIASGEPLALSQETIRQRGHAIEVRLYAEDATRNFLPSTGQIKQFIQPQGPGVRLDSGIDSGDEITPYYDPMIAKLIVYGEDRPTAITRLHNALEHTAIMGVTTNATFLYAISKHPAFIAGATHTSFLEEHGLLNSHPPSLPNEVLHAAALFAELHPATLSTNQSTNPWLTSGPWRMVGERRQTIYHFNDQDYKISITPAIAAKQSWNIQIGEQAPEQVTGSAGPDGIVLLRYEGGRQVQAYVQQEPAETWVVLAGTTYRLQRQQAPDIASTAQRGGPARAQKSLVSPMAGTIVKVQVRDGEEVEAHQTLVILSAMKMEHAVTAPYEGRVQRVLYQEGAVVPGGVVLVEME